MTLIGILMILAGVVGLVTVYRDPILVRDGGKPLAEPRTLSYLDAWQTVIFHAGGDADKIMARVMELFGSGESQRFNCRIERIWRWGLDGKTEREQIVLRHGRGIVFCQIYGYGSDLFVGWDAHLNLGSWKEFIVKRGVDKESGQRVRLTAVKPSTQAISEYDLVDLNCLLEWTHAQVAKVLKQYVKERDIDQEIDFAIIRGDRKSATQSKQDKPKTRLFRRA